MKAIVYQRYGPPDVLHFKEVEKPTPRDNEVLIKVHATTVNRTDYATIGGKPFFVRLLTGVFKPRRKTPGTESAGEITVEGMGAILDQGDTLFITNGTDALYLRLRKPKVVGDQDRLGCFTQLRQQVVEIDRQVFFYFVKPFACAE